MTDSDSTSWAPRTLRRLAQVLAVLFVANTFVLPQLAGTRKALELLGDLDPLLLLGGTAAEVASLAAMAHLIRSLVSAEHRPSSWTVQRVVLAARAASRVVPGGAAAGGVLSYRLLRRVGVPTADAGFSVGTQSIESAAVLVALLVVSMIVSIPLTGLNPAYISVASMGALLLVAVIATVVAVAHGNETAVDRARRAAAFTRVLDVDRVEALVRSLGSKVTELGAERRELGRHLAWSLCYWTLDATALWIFLAAYGHWTRPDALLVAYGLANVAATVPLTPGGLGVMEVTLSAALVGFGVPSGVALLGVVSWRLVNYWLPIPIGAAAYLSLRIGSAGAPAAAALGELTDEALIEADEVLPWRHRRPPGVDEWD